MTPDLTTSFLTYYIRSLAERTREEKSGTKYGFDWIIYNVALADDLTPYRLPFIRRGPEEISKTKTEPEFGIDLSFLSPDRRTLTIFALKDEELRNSTWTANDFDADIRRAAVPDLTPPEFREVQEVKVILAYNKDEDQTGIQLFNNLTKGLGSRVGDHASLSFERWNLTTITEKVKTKLLTPSLLPQRFFSLFSYICSQFADFRHGSDEWNNQLIPNWRRFLEDVLKGNADERRIRLLPVALIILREYGRENQSAETGWIDLAEWAMLAVWDVWRCTQKADVKQAVCEIWVSFYLAELERYYSAHAQELAYEDSLETGRSGSWLDAIAASVVAFWHIGRIGILGIGFGEILGGESDEERQRTFLALQAVANWLVGLLNANSAANRPLLDLHHIELFLIWRTLWQIGRYDDIYHWLKGLHQRLLVRRTGSAHLPFIEGYNSLEHVFEFVATGKKPPEYCDQSSLLLLSLIEFSFSLDPKRRDELVELFYSQIVVGQGADGSEITDSGPIDLMGWAPPEDWLDRVLSKSLAAEGESQTLEPFAVEPETEGASIATEIGKFVHQARAAQKFELPDIPASVLVLACLKLRSPLPPEFWRYPIFGAALST
ncbi:hypothetical protein LPW11_09835 [Geomonas sp. RF6]|uniref:hypothetical protein n=1 Tax=Geomonas sp. RF6 TaxID=2897342 RepID=UPI001E408AD4|nr:hypothetical protein [Geomonas sp. RF6]UFS72474.1 hypothetical protein LPW11_09835 [Geomonas sp. RF6]